jgi:hypothetical protein
MLMGSFAAGAACPAGAPGAPGKLGAAPGIPPGAAPGAPVEGAPGAGADGAVIGGVTGFLGIAMLTATMGAPLPSACALPPGPIAPDVTRAAEPAAPEIVVALDALGVEGPVTFDSGPHADIATKLATKATVRRMVILQTFHNFARNRAQPLCTSAISGSRRCSPQPCGTKHAVYEQYVS